MFSLGFRVGCKVGFKVGPQVGFKVGMGVCLLNVVYRMPYK